MFGAGSGLAEVELPIAYKMKNIQETERARQKQQDASQAHLSATATHSKSAELASFRYMKVHALPFIPRSSGHASSTGGGTTTANTASQGDTGVPTVPVPQSYSASNHQPHGGGSGAGRGGNTGMKSDDFLVQKFKKVRLAPTYVHRRVDSVVSISCSYICTCSPMG